VPEEADHLVVDPLPPMGNPAAVGVLMIEGRQVGRPEPGDIDKSH
jgi:hypothetical protein